MVGRGDKRANNRTMLQTVKRNNAAGYHGPAKIGFLWEGGGGGGVGKHLEAYLCTLNKDSVIELKNLKFVCVFAS